MTLTAPTARRTPTEIPPDPPAGTRRWDPVRYRAAVYLNVAADLIRVRGPIPQCASADTDPTRCDTDPGFPICVRCAVRCGRAAFHLGHKTVAAADLTASMVLAWEQVEAANLHLRPGLDAYLVAEELLAIARTLYAQALPGSVRILPGNPEARYRRLATP